MIIEPETVRQIRTSLNITQAQAAKAAGVSIRTWRSYEEPITRASSRMISERSLRALCKHYRLRYPPVDKRGEIQTPSGKVIAITALKGGVGKTPITEEVANLFAQDGNRVAIISNDWLYESIESNQDFRVYTPGNLLRVPEIDVLMEPNEIEQLQKKVDDDEKRLAVKGLSKALLSSFARERLERKSRYKFTFQEIVKAHDYVFLDLNHDPGFSCRHSDLVVLIVKAFCPFTLGSSRRFLELAMEFCDGVMPSNVRGLIVNKSILNPRDLSEELTEAIAEISVDSIKSANRWQKSINELPIPMLRSSLSAAVGMEDELANAEIPVGQRLARWRPITCGSPESLAAAELRAVRDEIVDCLEHLSAISVVPLANVTKDSPQPACHLS